MSKLDKKIEKWDSEEVLNNFAKFLGRVGISTQFITNEDGLMTHQVLVVQCDDQVIVSDPQELDWPLQVLPKPEALESN